jgi:uncharacterized protein with von Willebrand factor type A (vWA) domain
MFKIGLNFRGIWLIELAKKMENRFFSLIIGNSVGQINKIFNKEWVFNSYSNTLIELDEIFKK